MRAMQENLPIADIGPLGVLFVSCILTLLLASASYYLVEQRFFSSSNTNKKLVSSTGLQ